MLLISIRFFVASMALISLLSLASTVFSELPAILQNNAIVQDIYSGKVAIFMLLPALMIHIMNDQNHDARGHFA